MDSTPTKCSVLEELEALASLAWEAGSREIGRRLAEAAERLRKNRFFLVIMGQFKRGKSTLINAMLEDNLLPTAAVPLTSLVTRVSYGPKKRAVIIFKDGKTKEIPPEELHLYITENGNPRNRKQVEYAEITHPASYLAEGLVIVDTPGVGSLYRHNTEVTRSFLPSADAVIFILSADPPISEEEGNFLRDIKTQVPRIFLVLNKIDYLQEGEERDRVLEYCSNALASWLGEEQPKIYCLSAKEALEARLTPNAQKLETSGLPRLEKDIRAFLAGDRDRVALEAAVQRGLSYSRELKNILVLQERAIQAPLDQLQDKIHAFNKELGHILQAKDDALHIIRGQIELLIRTVEEDLETFKSGQVPIIQERIAAAAQEKKHLRVSQFEKELDGHLVELLLESFEAFRHEENVKVEKRYRDILSRFAMEINASLIRLQELSASLFSLTLESGMEVEDLTKESRFYYKFGFDPVMAPIDPAELLKLLPRRIGQKIIVKKMQKRAMEQLDRNCGSIRWDFCERCQRSLPGFRALYAEKVESTVEEINRALSFALAEKQKGSHHSDQALAAVRQNQQKLKKLQHNLRQLAPFGDGRSGAGHR